MNYSVHEIRLVEFKGTAQSQAEQEPRVPERLGSPPQEGSLLTPFLHV